MLKKIKQPSDLKLLSPKRHLLSKRSKLMLNYWLQHHEARKVTNIRLAELMNFKSRRTIYKKISSKLVKDPIGNSFTINQVDLIKKLYNNDLKLQRKPKLTSTDKKETYELLNVLINDGGNQKNKD